MDRLECTLETRGRIFRFGARTWIMGVLNVTPDSFSDGGLYLDAGRAAARAQEILAEGADIIDVGGESTRPGAAPVDEQEELGRVAPLIRRLRKETDALISVDTTKAAVAAAALDEGADIVNDISALRFDPLMARTVAREHAGLVLMHMQGTPETMQVRPRYRDVVDEVRDFLKERLEAAAEAGIPAGQVIVDPGIGFGKTAEHNLALIDGLGALARLERPILVGVSRKAFLGRILDRPADDRLEGTLSAAVLAADRGAHILRVHDVGAVRRAAAVADAVRTRNIAAPAPGVGKTPYVC
jgi:dihydropteroate synthase